ncbi:hypothetical protein CEXT_382721 [Caerostris extrusa]|uniref:Uncharacterized protein n=1 Tax=Caerostris extrusa TaxID=172846 RepID=A0AAV4SA58_CAEEX|nr:hypothetical protein CEXT_382721 [Caerostris extrusa]
MALQVFLETFSKLMWKLYGTNPKTVKTMKKPKALGDDFRVRTNGSRPDLSIQDIRRESLGKKGRGGGGGMEKGNRCQNKGSRKGPERMKSNN